MEKKFTQDELDDAMAEGFVAGAIRAREVERDRIRTALLELDVVVLHIQTVLDLLKP
ncbi:hypothetical protein UFOVP223_52 [uncultured Caudovirales phage]|uniref:Uncharacterized protein n=1 Tax=uncultured Caudovirales phage TaxID=2100421 RepID=A0A6J5L5U2_9CAUD|nr:hypothetical protein UFOVP110_112 [uncultured Caudovirales phage]CAB5219285.1 hypothetical protein UFOVP223_52 [uncultured Caudovirales phage]